MELLLSWLSAKSYLSLLFIWMDEIRENIVHRLLSSLPCCSHCITQRALCVYRIRCPVHSKHLSKLRPSVGTFLVVCHGRIWCARRKLDSDSPRRVHVARRFPTHPKLVSKCLEHSLNGMYSPCGQVTYSLTFYCRDSKWQSKTGTDKQEGVPSCWPFVCCKFFSPHTPEWVVSVALHIYHRPFTQCVRSGVVLSVCWNERPALPKSWQRRRSDMGVKRDGTPFVTYKGLWPPHWNLI